MKEFRCADAMKKKQKQNMLGRYKIKNNNTKKDYSDRNNDLSTISTFYTTKANRSNVKTKK